MTYNEIMQKEGKRINKKVYYVKNGVTTYVNINNINKVKMGIKGQLVGTLIGFCELELKELIDGTIYITIEATYGNETKSMSYGGYYLREQPTYNADKKTYSYRLYDSMIKSMTDYKSITINYPTTIYNFFTQLISEIGYTTTILSLPNGSRQMQEDIYDGINYTYRDVLDDIAQANGVLFYMDGSVIKIANLDNANVINVDDDILKNQNIDFGEHFGPINTIVLSRSYDTDVIYKSYPDNLPEEDRIEYEITDNQLMNGEDREDYLQALLNRLRGTEYDIYDTELVGYGNVNPLQKVAFTTNGKSYASYIFNEEKTFTDGFKQAIYSEMPEEAVVDYKSASPTEKAVREASIIIDRKIAQVDIKGKTINLTADNINITSNNFAVDTNGRVIATAGEIAGYTIDTDSQTSSKRLEAIAYPTDDFTETDYNKVRDYLLEIGTLTPAEIIKYDLNKNGVVDSQDLLMLRQLIIAGVTTTSGIYVRLSSNPNYLNENYISLIAGDRIIFKASVLEGVQINDGNIYGARTLFSDPNGEDGDVTLQDEIDYNLGINFDITSYKYFEIFAKDEVGQKGIYLKLNALNDGDVFNLSAVGATSSNSFIRRTKYTVSGNTLVPSNGGYSRITANSANSSIGTNLIYITEVLGYK